MDRVDHETLIIQDVINFYAKKELDLNPWYQRRSVWTTPQKAYLINTLFEQKPIPSVYVRHSLDLQAEKSIREVADGQQRLKSILEYADNVFAAKHPNHEKKVFYRELTRTEQERFKLTGLSVGYLLGATEADVVEIFGRLNSVSKTLNDQEKRNSMFSGEFKQFCLKEAAYRLPIWRQLRIFTANDISRMLEVQFVSDLVLNLLEGLSDYKKSALNKIYSLYDEAFDPEKNVHRRLDKVFAIIAGLPPASIKDTIFSRQPLFFSLCVALDGLKGKIFPGKVANGLFAVDAMFNDDVDLEDRKKDDAAFIVAVNASTQRIKSRMVRHKYISDRIK